MLIHFVIPVYGMTVCHCEVFLDFFYLLFQLLVVNLPFNYVHNFVFC